MEILVVRTTFRRG